MSTRPTTSFKSTSSAPIPNTRITTTTTPSISRTTSNHSQSRSTRGDNPRRQSSSSLHQQGITRMTTPSPSPRKSRRRGAGVGRSDQRQPLDPHNPTHESSDDDRALLDLLGVSSPAVEEQKKGLLTLSKEGMDEVLEGKRNNGVNSPTPKTRTRNPKPANVSDGEVRPNNQPKSRTKVDKSAEAEKAVPKVVSGITAGKKRLPKSNTHQQQAPDQAFDVTSLSQSLPTGGFFASTKSGNGKGKNTDDESSVWDMPVEMGHTGVQELTWQQKLQAQDSTPKKSRSSKSKTQPRSSNLSLSASTSSALPSTTKASLTQSPHHPVQPKLVSSNSTPQPTLHNQARRLSLDPSNSPSLLPNSNTSGNGAAVNNRPISQFDGSIPWHTGMNANRAPQTPLRGRRAGCTGTGAGHGTGGGVELGLGELPILAQEFPRIGKGQFPASSQTQGLGHGQAKPTPLLGPKYAGPTFHNSPHAGSLPKPDLDDF